MRFLGLCGSLRAASTNRALLEAFRRHGLPENSVKIFDDLGRLPLFNPDHEGEKAPQAVLDLARMVGVADAIIIASPEYAHGIPGALKNALDWLVSRFEIPGKPVMLVHASVRGQFVREHLSEVLRTMSTRIYEGRVFEVHLIGKSAEAAAATLDEASHVERIRAVLADFSAFIASGK